jgi:citrate lyase subunit beta/citryl-CoA lyase
MAAPAIRPRRSALYVPGSNQRALEKARDLDADVLIFDFEDGVAPDCKEEARKQVAAALKAGGYKAERVIRINHPSTKLGAADLKAVAASGCDAVLLPMIETPLGVLRAQEIVFSGPHLKCLVMGTSDLAKDLRARHTPDRLPVLTSLSLCILAARAAGLPILDGVHLDLEDEKGFLASCRQGAELGFDGKTLIHPKTIAAANAAFGPSKDEVALARRIIDAHAAALKKGQGVAVVDGKLVEQLHVESAKRTVALSEVIARRG